MPFGISNVELEKRWIASWNDLDEIIGHRCNVRCLLLEGEVVEPEANQCWRVQVQSGLALSQPGLIASRWRE